MHTTCPRHLLSVRDLARPEVERLLQRAEVMESSLESGERLTTLEGKILATLFFQPSTRTRLSFEAAMLRLGGDVIGFADREQSRSGAHSVSEALADTARVVDGYADAIVVRHPEIGAARELASYATRPVVNAGDGQGALAEHPTQALLDLYAIWQQTGRLDGVRVAVVGGLHQRVCHSLLIALSLFHDVEVKLVAPLNDRLTEDEFAPLAETGMRLDYVDAVDHVIPDVDVVYHGGMSEDPNQPVPDPYLLSAAKLGAAPDGLVVLHPLPRHAEIAPDVDRLPCAGYFRQSTAGVPVRMAVLESILA